MQRTVFALIAAVAVLLIGGIFLLGRGKPASAPQTTTTIENPDPLLKAHVALGSPEAPIAVVEFSNYRCPHCREHALNVLGRIMTDYVEPGKVRYVFRSLPFEGQEDVFAASVAAGCAFDQSPDRFLDYHLLLFRAVEDWAGLTGEALSQKLTDYARQLSLDPNAFRACLESEEAKARVRFDQELARALGVDGTPTFFINGEKKVGFMPYETWRSLLGP